MTVHVKKEDPSRTDDRWSAVGDEHLTEAELRQLLDALPYLAWTCLAQGPCNYLSHHWVKYTGIPEVDQLGYAWLNQLHPDDRERTIGEWGAAVKLGVPFDIEFRIRRADGAHRWFRTRAIPLRDDSGQIFKWYGSNADIEDYKQALHQLEVSNAELGAFSYSVAHDLRAPLRGMNGFAEVLLDEYQDKLDADALDCLREIQVNALKMGHLIDSLLSLSRTSRAELVPQNVNLSKIARDVAKALALAAPERRVEVVIAQGIHADLDPRLARAAVENLLENAWKFTQKELLPRIEFGTTEIGGTRVLFVRDNGAGFDMSYAEKLFVPFQRLHKSEDFPGTGIGLVTVQRIIHRHGGRIWAEGRVDDGACFYFTVPEARGIAI